MERINKPLLELAKRLALIDENQEPEPYILTKEDENKLVEFEVNSAKEYMKWRMTQASATKQQIDTRIRDTDWDELINKDELFQRANSVKNHEIWLNKKHISDKEEEEKRIRELKGFWTAKKMYNLMAWTSQNKYSRKLVVNDHNRNLITALCFFLSHDERFETELGFSFKKGLLIRGATGLGKTHLVRCVEDNLLSPILTLSMIEISEELMAYGEYEINKANKKIIYLDDVGTEETPVVHFGTKIYFFKNFIESIYLRNKESGFGGLIMSSNFNFKQTSDKYGFRVASRMRDMFNVVDVSGNDMRSNQGN